MRELLGGKGANLAEMASIGLRVPSRARDSMPGMMDTILNLGLNDETAKSFPQDVMEQLWGAIGAVFKSWKNSRAIIYRQQYGIPAEWGTAVNVQAMVFGNWRNKIIRPIRAWDFLTS